jgi:prepilin-type N-terminal cleavage/methylation domain-containing protein
MNKRGLSLVELLVAIAIIGIVLSLTTLNFSKMTKKGNAETAVRELYSDITTAQMDSLRTHRRHQVTFNAGSYVIRRYSSATDATGTVRLQKTLKETLTSSAPSPSLPVVLTFSEKCDPSVSAGTIPFALCLSANDAGAAVDCIVVSEGKINLAKKREGESCAPANCDLR